MNKKISFLNASILLSILLICTGCEKCTNDIKSELEKKSVISTPAFFNPADVASVTQKITASALGKQIFRMAKLNPVTSVPGNANFIYLNSLIFNQQSYMYRGVQGFDLYSFDRAYNVFFTIIKTVKKNSTMNFSSEAHLSNPGLPLQQDQIYPGQRIAFMWNAGPTYNPSLYQYNHTNYWLQQAIYTGTVDPLAIGDTIYVSRFILNSGGKSFNNTNSNATTIISHNVEESTKKTSTGIIPAHSYIAKTEPFIFKGDGIYKININVDGTGENGDGVVFGEPISETIEIF